MLSINTFGNDEKKNDKLTTMASSNCFS